MGKLRKFVRLPVADRWLLLQIFIFLPLTRLGLRLFGFKRTFAIVAWSASVVKQPPPVDEAGEIERLRHWIRFTKQQGPYRGNCLSRSLVLWWLLRRQDIQCEIRIGTRTLAGEFQAHAWLEYVGKPINAGSKVQQKYVLFNHVFTP